MPEEIDRYGRMQLGLVTAAQARQAWSASGVQRARRTGQLLDELDHVYRLPGSPRSWRQRALAACLSIGPPVALSGLAAGYLYQADPIARPPIQVTVPHCRRPRTNGVIVRRQRLPDDDIGERNAIPVTSPARTTIDLSRTLDIDGLQRFADDLVRRHLLTVGELAQRFDAPLPWCDRRALVSVIERLQQRGTGDSPREEWAVDTLVAAGLPTPERLVKVELGGRIREIDLAYVGPKVAIEYDGWAAHADRRHFEGDREKSALLQLAGWIVLQVTTAWTAELLVERVSQALQSRGWSTD